MDIDRASDGSRIGRCAGWDRSLNLSILLVNHNGLPFLADCLDSIKRFAPAKTDVILADNASTDESIEFLAREYPWVHVLSSSRNLGFAGGNNLAASKAQGRLLLLLNTDTILLDPISPAVEWLESHPDYSVVTINMLDGEQQPRACTGHFPSPSRLVFLRRMLVEPQQYRCDSFHDVDWVQGSFLAHSRGTLEAVEWHRRKLLHVCRGCRSLQESARPWISLCISALSQIHALRRIQHRTLPRSSCRPQHLHTPPHARI